MEILFHLKEKEKDTKEKRKSTCNKDHTLANEEPETWQPQKLCPLVSNKATAWMHKP